MFDDQLRPMKLLITVAFLACGATPAPAEEPPRPAQLISVLGSEIDAGLSRRKVREAFDRYQAFSDGRLDHSAGKKTWSDKTGNCRLGWFDRLMRRQIDTPQVAEKFSRRLHKMVVAGHLQDLVREMAAKLDAPITAGGLKAAGDSMDLLIDALNAARRGFDGAMAPLDVAERLDLETNLYVTTTQQVKSSGAIFPEKDAARRLCNLLERMDRGSLHAAALALVSLRDQAVSGTLARLPANDTQAPAGVEGPVHAVVRADAGLIIIGGPGTNVYHLDDLVEVCAIVDFAGDDVYHEGTTSRNRPLLVLIDHAGNDRYVGTKPGVQGSAILGLSALFDLSGDDVYEAQDVAQGACLGGIGIHVDMAGNDTYRAKRRAHGSALGGIGLLVDRAGNDSYHAALFAQGFGGPLGFGLHDDLTGDDRYYAGGLYLDSYDDTPGYAGFSQGVGAGPRGSANGGIGVLLDGGGDDLYECDYFSHGGAYWFAIGIARDFGGNDRRVGSTRLGFDGKPRGEKIFLRWGHAWQAHYGLAFLIDDEGDDVYGGDIVGLGFSWDIGVAALIDLGGDDHYQTPAASQGQGAQAGIGILFDVGGDDVHEGDNTGHAAANVSYHPMPDCGGNFSFAVNYEGRDTYNGKVLHNVDLERASPQGFLIQRGQTPTAAQLQR